MLFFVLGFISSVSHATSPTRDATVWRRRTDGYQAFRIPGIARTPNGTILAFAEGRVRVDRPPVLCVGWPNTSCCVGILANCCDNRCRDKDIVVKSSHDGGRSWVASRRLTQSSRTHVYTNPTAVADATTGKVWLMYQRCNNTAPIVYAACTNVLRYATGNGAIWSEEIFPPQAELNCTDPITRCQQVKGPGAGVQLQEKAGGHLGRLILQGWHNLISDDHGVTWVASRTPTGCGECGAAELANGNVMLAGPDPPNHFNPWVHVSTDGGNSFPPYQHDRRNNHHDTTITDDDMELSILAPGDRTHVYMAHANRPDITGDKPHNNMHDRQNCTISKARVLNATAAAAAPGGDGLGPWQDEVRIFDGPSGYTSMLDLGDGECGVIYERGELGELPIQFESMNFAVFPCV